MKQALGVKLRKICGLVGVGERAFPRAGPALFTSGYNIICSLRTLDLEDIGAWAKVECFQEAMPHVEPPSDTYSLLSQEEPWKTRGILKAGTRLVLYRQTAQIQEMARQKGWVILANPPEKRLPWEHKCWFRKRLLSMGLPALEFESVNLEFLSPERCSQLMDRWGTALVVQIPCFPQGGGRSSFVVKEPSEIIQLRAAWGNGTHRGHGFRQVMLSPFLGGTSLSMEGCVTPWGILVSPLQLQLVDIPEVLPPTGFGRFCGHQWGYDLPGETWVEQTARIITQQVGRAMAQEGYRGIFGLDFLLDERKRALRVLECNPRYTGAFPTLTLLQLHQGLPPLELFHLLSWMGEDSANMDPHFLEGTHSTLQPAAQVLLFHRNPWKARVTQELPSGLYMWLENEAGARRIGAALPFPVPPVPEEHFVLLDGPPPAGHVLRKGSELERVARLIFFKHILGPRPGSLLPEVTRVIQWVYQSLGLEPI